MTPGCPAATPHRVLVVSADMGGGHDATAAALEESVHSLWPGSQTMRVDTLDLMGRWVGRVFRQIYVTNVERTPWLYEFFYSALWRHRWFALASKRFTGSWSGRPLGRVIDRFDPDLVLSTYPLGTAGLAWSRRHRQLQPPVAAYVSDFAPHPFWVHADIAVTFVVHEAAASTAVAAEPRALTQVCAPPVRSGFEPGDRALARRAHGLALDGFVVLVSCGSYAFGDVLLTVRSLLASCEQVQVVVACGKDELTRTRLARLGLPRRRLVPVGWTPEMAGLIQACDVVLCNAGGAIALEALTCGRPVLIHRPIAAHGQANADLMVVSGLAEITTDEDQLIAWVRAAAEDPSVLHEMAARGREHVTTHSVSDGLSRLARGEPVSDGRRRGRVRGWGMRPSDAFFVHVAAGGQAQELGAVLELDEGAPAAPLTLEVLRTRMRGRLPGLPPLHRLIVGGGRPSWGWDPEVDVCDHVTECRLGATDAGGVDGQIDRFWSTPLPEGRPPWAVLLVHSPHEGRAVLAVKMHHALGDGVSALGLLDRLIDPAAGDPLAERGPARQIAAHPGAGGGGGPGGGPGGWATAVGESVTGLASLALRSAWSRHPLNHQTGSTGRTLVTVSVDHQRLRHLARTTRTHVHEVAIALIGSALSSLLGQQSLVLPGHALRVMVPVARRPPRLDRVFGNWTGSLAVDLPLDDMPFTERLARTRAELRRRNARGEARAGALVLQVIGHLPPALYAAVARRIYTRRFFDSIVSFMPGARGPRQVGPARVRAVYPVVPLADGVPLTVGVVVSGDTAGFGVFLDAALGLARSRVAGALDEALERAEREVG